MNRRPAQTGVTLIELLVAMTLFSLLSVAVLFSLRTATRTLERTRERVTEARRYDAAERALERMLGGILRVNGDYSQQGTDQASSAPFFQGEPSAMRFVTSYSLAQGARGPLHIAEFAVIPRGDRQGVRLIVNEVPYFGPASAGALMLGPQINPAGGAPLMQFVPVSAGPQSFVLADRLPACQFLYLERDVTNIDRWVPAWRQNVLPRAIRVNMGKRAVTGQVYVSQMR